MFKNVKNPAFKRNAMILLVLGILMYYVFCVTVGEQISILATYLSAETGWNPNAIVLPITYAGILSIAFTFLCNTAFMKFNAKHVIVGATAVVGVGFALIGLSSTILNFTLFFATLFVIRSIVTFLNNGCNYLCGNWFSENRGKALGVVTIGGPLSSATFIALATFGVNSSLGFSGIYYIIGALIVVMAIVMGIFLKNSPEEIGAYPDGADKPSQALPDQQKNLDIAKTIPFSETNVALKEYVFSGEEKKPGSVWQLLCALRECELKNDALLDIFYEVFGEKYPASGDYAVYFFHGNYDVPRKAKDKESLWESEEVYRFLICAVCPVSGDYEPGMPVCGFMFPAFKDRGPDNGRIQVFEADPARPHRDFLNLILPVSAYIL